MRNDFRSRLVEEIPHLRRFARTLARDEAHADDLVQSALERALKKQRLWKPSGKLRPWLFRILHRLSVDQYRREAPRSADRRVEDYSETLAAPETPGGREGTLTVVDAFKALPVEQREAISLVAVEGLDYAEAARVMGVPEGTLRSRLARGRASLRELAADSERKGTSSHLRRVK